MLTQRRIFAALGLSAALTLSACGGSSGAVATVNGTDITAAQVEEQFEILSTSSGEPAEGTTQEEHDEQLTISGLNRLIFGQILLDSAADIGIEATEDDIDATRSELVVQYGGEDDLYNQLEEQGMDREEVDREIELLTTQNAVIDSLAQEITDDEIQTAYDEGASARHILVEDEGAANDVLNRLDGGEDFADIAAEVSTDQGSAESGGELGFTQPDSGFVAEFEDALFGAEDGEVVGPVETQFGFHIIERLVKPALADVEDEIRGRLEQQRTADAEQEFGTMVEEWAQNAEVTVHDPDYGMWDAEAGFVVPADDDSEQSDDSGDTDESGTETETPDPDSTEAPSE